MSNKYYQPRAYAFLQLLRIMISDFLEIDIDIAYNKYFQTIFSTKLFIFSKET